MEIQNLLLQFDRIREDGRIRDWMARAQPDLRHTSSHPSGTARAFDESCCPHVLAEFTPYEARVHRPRWVPTGDEGAAEMACLSYFAHGAPRGGDPGLLSRLTYILQATRTF